MKDTLQMDGPGAAPPDADPDLRAVVDRLFGLARYGVKMGLDRVEGLLADVGHPERSFRVVHVAGSNGKGSTTAFLATMLARAGYRVGTFTSPHLVSVLERVQVLEGQVHRNVASEVFVQAVRRLEAARPGLEGLTFFEVMTAAGMLALAAEGVEVAVIEAGLGAKKDATRVVPAEVAVLTDLSLEHTNVLGDTIEAIADDEGRVARPHRPMLAADGPAGAMAVVEGIAAEVQADLRWLGRDFDVEVAADGRVSLRVLGRDLNDVQLSLLGRHQARNAAIAAAAALSFDPAISDEALLAGLEQAVWPGRLERSRTAAGVRVLLDGAQNAHAARALARALAELEALAGPRHFVFGVLSDKDAAEMLVALTPHADSFVFTRPASPRARDPSALAGLVVGVPTSVLEDPGEAFAAAAARARLDGGWVVVCGSLYLVGKVRGRSDLA